MSNDFKSNESAAETTDSEIRVSRTGQPVSCVFTGGTVLGGYLRLEEKLGRGGMGETWKASDLMAKRSVVVKVVPPEISNTEDAMEQVRTNFQRVHTLQHQHICPVFGLIDDPAYGVYVVMKFINGKTLDVYRRDYIAEHGRFSLSEAIRILWDVARALDYSHERKVIHRDVKLQNIMISPEDGVQLIDFGLAGEISSSMPMESETPLEVSGTRTYMAPEQWLGLPQDARTDQYALAVTAYKLFSGHKPFRRDNEAALKECVLNEEPRPIAGIPEYINAALLKALSKKQEDRFDNCRAFIKAMAEKPKKPKEVQQTVLNKVKSLVRKIDRRLLIASGAAAGLLLGLLVFMFSSSPPTGGLTPAAINDSDKVPETTTQSIQETMLAADDNPPEEEMTHAAGGLSPAARNDAASNDDTLTPEEQTEIDDFCAEYGVKAADENGETLLHEAAKSGKIAVAKYLVSKGADIHAKNKYGNTTLDDAKAQQHTAVAEYLESVLEQSRNREIAEEAGAKAPASLALTFTPEEQAEIDHFIAQYGGDAKAADAEGETLLHKAAKSGKIAVVKFLVSQGADIHAKNNWGDFPLLYAARNGHLEIAKYLVSKGADVNAKDNSSWTPLHHAANNKRIEFVKFLVSEGADVQAKSKDGKTPFDMIKGKENKALEEYLESVSTGGGIPAALDMPPAARIEPIEVAEAKKTFDEALKQAAIPYCEELEKELTLMRKRGDTKYILNLENELKHTASEDGTKLTPFSPDKRFLYNTKLRFKKDIETAVGNYQKQLQTLVKTLTQEKRTDDAKIVQEILDHIVVQNQKIPETMPTRVTAPVMPVVRMMLEVDADGKGRFIASKGLTTDPYTLKFKGTRFPFSVFPKAQAYRGENGLGRVVFDFRNPDPTEIWRTSYNGGIVNGQYNRYDHQWNWWFSSGITINPQRKSLSYLSGAENGGMPCMGMFNIGLPCRLYIEFADSTKLRV